MFACGTEDGQILVADIRNGPEYAVLENHKQEESMSI